MKSDDTETRRKSGKGYSEESNKIKRWNGGSHKQMNRPDVGGSTHLWNDVYYNETTRRNIPEGSKRQGSLRLTGLPSRRPDDGSSMHAPLKYRSASTTLHVALSQKVFIFIFAAKTWNLTEDHLWRALHAGCKSVPWRQLAHCYQGAAGCDPEQLD
jgi:hypothetical protein